MSNYHVAAYATSNAGYSKFYDYSCREVAGFEPVILGFGRDWIGFASGFIYLVEWLKTIPERDVVLVCDRYDIVFTGPLRETVFAEFEAGDAANPGKEYFYISADVNQLFQRSFWGPLKAQNCQLNSGTYVMRAGPLLKMLGDILAAFAANLSHIDDQRQITEYLNAHEDEIAVGVDHTKHILLYIKGDIATGMNLRFKKIPGMQHKALFYKNRPISIIHRPGSADMVQILKDLGYTDVERHIEDRRPFYYLEKIPAFVRYYTLNPMTAIKNAVQVKA